MNVSYSNSITNTVKDYREHLYCTDEFQKEFSNKLKKSICATTTSYVPDQFGGWDVNVSVNTAKLFKDNSVPSSSSYVKKIAESLASVVHSIDKTLECDVLAPNLANVILTGSDSITIKI